MFGLVSINFMLNHLEPLVLRILSHWAIVLLPKHVLKQFYYLPTEDSHLTIEALVDVLIQWFEVW